MRRITVLISLLLCSFSVIYGQTQGIGLYPFGSFDAKGFDTINLGNLNTHFAIPIGNKAGRGISLTYPLVYDGLIWSNISTSGSNAWQITANSGFQGSVSGGPSGALSYSTADGTGCGYGGNYIYTVWNISSFIYIDSLGAPHTFNYSVAWNNCTAPTITGTGMALDNSGLTISYTPTGYIVTARNGTITKPLDPNWDDPLGSEPANESQVIDNNGNTITTNANGTITDTLGVAAITFSGSGTASSPRVITYPVTEQTNGATSASVTIYYKTYTVQTNFQCAGITEYGATSIDLVDHITLPDAYSGTYRFQYEQTPNVAGGSLGPPVTGRLASITLPSGGTISYAYSGGNAGCQGINPDGTPAIMARTTTDGTKTYTHWIQSDGFSATNTTDELQNQSSYMFFNNFYTNSWYELERTVWQGSASGTPLQNRTTSYNAQAVNDPMQLTAPITETSVLESFNGGSQSETVNTYSGNLLTNSAQVSATSGNTLAAESVQYNSLGEPMSVIAYDGSQNIVSKVTYGYDESEPIITSGIPQHNRPYTIYPGYNSYYGTAPGNLTSSHISTGSGTIDTAYVNYDTGVMYTSTGPNGTITYGYDSTQALNTSIVLPTPSSGVGLMTSAGFDVSSGAQLSSSMPNGSGGVVTQFDPLLRPTVTSATNGGQTVYSYYPNQVSVWSEMNSSQWTAQTAMYDPYGRLWRTATYNGSQWYLVDTCYDPAGNVQYESAPYASGNPSAAANCSTGTGVKYSYDALGRVIGTTRPDGTSTTTTYNSRAVMRSTSLGVGKIVQLDLLGRTSAVCELSTSSLPGSVAPSSCGMDIAGTGYVTTYTYNLASHTTTITQGAQQRIFQTDAAGRTIYTLEPERGATSYSYNYNSVGLVVTRTRPQENQTNGASTTVTTKQFDSVGRLVSIQYTNGATGQPDVYTPTKTYQYDQTVNVGMTTGYNKGLLTSASTGSSLTGWVLSYDQMGRLNYTDQCFPGRCGNSVFDIDRAYFYDYSGDVTSDAYVFGTAGQLPQQVNTFYGYTSAQEISTISNTLGALPNNDGGVVLSNVQNGPTGPSSYQLGNGLNGSVSYDSSGRPSGRWLCINSTQTSCSGGSQVYGTTANLQGSQMTSLFDTVINSTMSFGYDEFNRLKTVSANGGAASLNWSYDQYGNRWAQDVTQGSAPSPSLSFNPSTNQALQLSYDAAGNVTYDGSHQYTYDAEGNVVAVDGGNTASYVYDALGHRVQVTANGLITQYAFATNGQRVSAWDGTACAPTMLYHYTYWNGAPVAIFDGTQTYFQHQDLLGTERLRTASDGSVMGTYQSLPFGDNLAVSGADYDAHHFAGLDRDSESWTEHAQFRQYSSTDGRWMSPDPYDGSYNLSNPQSLNRYTYALNNPVRLIDPSGLDYCIAGGYDELTGGTGDQAMYQGPMQCDQGGGTWYQDPPDTDGSGGPCEANSPVCYVQVSTALPVDLFAGWSPGGLSPIGPGSDASATGDQGGGVAPSNGPNYSMADICAASTLLNKGVGTALDAFGIIPGEGNLMKGAQALGGLISAGLAIFQNGSAADLGFSGAGLGITAVDTMRVIRTNESIDFRTINVATKAGEGVGWVPVVGNIVSVAATINDISGKDGMVNYYNNCMAGKS